MGKTTQQVWNNLNLLQTKSPYDTYRRQRMYLEELMNRENVADDAKRKFVLEKFGLNDKRQPADTNYEDTWQGFVGRAWDRGGEQIEQIYEGSRAHLATALDDPEMYKSARESLIKSQRESARITEVQEQYTDSGLERWFFDATASLPVMAVALTGSAATAFALTTVKIPALFAGIIGYGLSDALLESGHNFGDVITHPRMIEALTETLGHKPTDTELSNISTSTGKLLAERASDAATRTGIANLFNPINIAESRMKILGGGGWMKRLGKRAILEATEEGAQSVVSQASREAEIGKIAPSKKLPEGDPVTGWSYKPGEALYEASIGAAVGPVVSLPQTYRGIQADKRAESERIQREGELTQDWGTTDPSKVEFAKDELRKDTITLLNEGDLESLDRIHSDSSPGKQDVMDEVIKSAKIGELGLSTEGKIRDRWGKTAQKTAKDFNPGTHIPPDTDRKKAAPAKISDWQFDAQYSQALEAFKMADPSPRQRFMLKYAEHEDNPTLPGFERRWAIEQKTNEQLKDLGHEPVVHTPEFVTQEKELLTLQRELIRLQREQLKAGGRTTKTKTQEQKVREEIDRLKSGGVVEEDVPESVESKFEEKGPVEGKAPKASPADQMLPSIPDDGVMFDDNWREGIKKVFWGVLGDRMLSNAGTTEKNRLVKDEEGRQVLDDKGNKVKEKYQAESKLKNRLNQALSGSKAFPSKGVGMKPFAKAKSGKRQVYNQKQAEFAALNAAIIMHSDGHITGQELEQIKQAINSGVLPQQFGDADFTWQGDQDFQGEQAEAVITPSKEAIEEEGIDADEPITKAEAKIILENLYNFDESLSSDIVESLPEEFSIDELNARAKAMSLGDPKVESDVDRPSVAAVSDIIELFIEQESKSTLPFNFSAHVAKLIERDKGLTKEQRDDSRILTEKKEDLAREMARDYISAVKSVHEIEGDIIPAEYLKPKRVRGVFNRMFGKSEGMYLSRPLGYDEASVNKTRKLRIEEISKRLLDEDYKGMSQGNLDLSKNLSISASRDGEGMAFIDSANKVIPAEGSIPEGAVLLETTQKKRKIDVVKEGGKSLKEVNRINYWVWTGEGQALRKRRDKGKAYAFGFWYKAYPDAGDTFSYEPSDTDRTSGKHKDTPHWNLPHEFYKKTHFAQDGDQMGMKLTAAYLGLSRPDFEGNFIRFHGSVFTLKGSGRFEKPEGRHSEGKWSDEQKDVMGKIGRSNKLKRDFDNIAKLTNQTDIDNQVKAWVDAVNVRGREIYGDLVENVKKGKKSEKKRYADWVDVDGDYIDGEFIVTVQGSPGSLQQGFEPAMDHFGFKKKGKAVPTRRRIDGKDGKKELMTGAVDVTYISPEHQRMPFTEKAGQEGPQAVETDAEVDAIPDTFLPVWLKEFIKETRALPRDAFDKLIVNKFTGKAEKLNQLTLPDSLKPDKSDVESIANAKRNLIDSIFNATSRKYYTDTRSDIGVTTDVDVMVDIPKLWMAMKMLRQPGREGEAMAHYIETITVNKGMSDAEIRGELETLDLMLMGMNGLEMEQRRLMDEIILNNDELKGLEQIYKKRMDKHEADRAKVQKNAELGFYKTKEEATKAVDDVRVGYIRDTQNISTNIRGEESQASSLKAQLDKINDEIAELTSYEDNLLIALATSKQKALEEAKSKLGKKAKEKKKEKEETVDELYEVWGKNTKLIDNETVKDENGITFRAAVGHIQSALYEYAKEKSSQAGAKAWAPDANSQELLTFVQDFVQKNHKGEVLGINESSSSIYGPGIYMKGWDKTKYNKQVNKATGKKDNWGPQWAKNAVTAYILANPIKGTQFTEAEITPKGDTPLEKSDVLVEADPDNIGYLDYTSRAISPSQIMGQLKLTPGVSKLFVEKITEAPFWSDAEDNPGVDFDMVINSGLDWSKPAKSEQKSVQANLNDNQALKVISKALSGAVAPKFYTSANKLFNDIRRLTYEYLKGLTKYGETAGKTRTVNNKEEWFLPEINQAFSSDLITKKQAVTLEEMFKKAIAGEEVKKKL